MNRLTVQAEITLNQSGILGLRQTWIGIRCLKPSSVDLKSTPLLLTLFRRTVECWFSVELQKCLVDKETSPNFPAT